MSAGPHKRRRHRAGFTLVELMISLSLMMMLMLALLSSYVFILRGDSSLTNYIGMNVKARALLEQLGRDLRSATDVTNFTATNLMLKVPNDPAALTTQDVIWNYDGSNVTRQDSGGTQTLVTNVQTFAFYYTNSNNVQTASLVEVKQVQLTLRILRVVAAITTSEYVISAQFTMRAKSTAH